MEIIKHLLGFCGESHLNIFTIILTIVILKLIYEKYTRKTFWGSRG